MILLDASSIFISTVMAQRSTFEQEPEMVRHTIFNIIRRYNLEFREQFGEMVVCFDSKKNWRKDRFPHYKANRKKSRQESDMNWKVIFEIIDEVKQEICTYTPYKCVEVEGCEADDVIGTICASSNTPEPILIISPDKDFVQLQKYPQVRQYSNIQKKWVEPDVDPESDLIEKVLTGDKGDGVPNVLSDDLTFVEDRRQNRLIASKKKMLVENPEALGTTVARNYIRNRDLVDLDRTPEDLKAMVREEFKKPPGGSVMRLMTLFTKKQMKLMLESLQDFEVRSLNK